MPEVMAGGSCSIYSAMNKILNLVQHCEVGSRFVIHIHICKSAARMWSWQHNICSYSNSDIRFFRCESAFRILSWQHIWLALYLKSINMNMSVFLYVWWPPVYLDCNLSIWGVWCITETLIVGVFRIWNENKSKTTPNQSNTENMAKIYDISNFWPKITHWVLWSMYSNWRVQLHPQTKTHLNKYENNQEWRKTKIITKTTALANFGLE